MIGVLQEMKVIPYLEEVLVDDNHLTIKDQKLLEEEEQMDHLMEILEIMDPLVMKDILQDEDHQEEVDFQNHQEEDHLVPLAHLEILGPQEIKDLQAPRPQGHRGPPGPQGPMGPQGPPGQIIRQSYIPGTTPPPQVMMDTSSLERTFLGMANAAEKLARQQVVSNEQLNESVREQKKE